MYPQTIVAGHNAETGGGFDEDFIFPLFAKDPKGLQLHLVERDLGANVRNNQVINPIGVAGGLGHVAFRVDNLSAFRKHLDELGIYYSDYGTSFAAEWDQLYFLDPEGASRASQGIGSHVPTVRCRQVAKK